MKDTGAPCSVCWQGVTYRHSDHQAPGNASNVTYAAVMMSQMYYRTSPLLSPFIIS